MVNGNPASAYSIVDDDTISFTFTINPVSDQGLQTVRRGRGHGRAVE